MEGQTNGTAPAGQPTQQMVAIPEASDADLDAFLGGAHLQDPAAVDPAGQQPEVETEAEQPSEQAPQEVEQEKGAEEKPQTDATQTPDEMVQEIEKLQARLAQQEQFIKRRSTELGELRKQLRERNEQLKGALQGNEIFLENPEQAIDLKLQMRENEARLKNIDQEEQDMVRVHETQRLVTNYVKPGEVDMQDVANVLRADGLGEDFIGAFVQNPWTMAQPETMIHLLKRAKAERDLKALAAYTQQLLQEKKALKGKPDQMLKNIQSAMKQTPSINAATGGSAGVGGGIGVSPSSLSDAEIEAFLQQKR